MEWADDMWVVSGPAIVRRSCSKRNGPGIETAAQTPTQLKDEPRLQAKPHEPLRQVPQPQEPHEGRLDVPGIVSETVAKQDTLPGARSAVLCHGETCTRCGVCGDGSNLESNPLLRCEACAVLVHRVCVGEMANLGRPFKCRPCWADATGLTTRFPDAGRTPERRCQLCPNRGGALVEVEGANFSLWAHIMCVIWVPELWFGDPAKLSPACGTHESKVVLDRFKLKCCVCGQRNAGACIQCGDKKCMAAAHVSCAMASGMYLRYNEDARGDLRMDCFCRKHEPERLADAPSSLESLNMSRGDGAPSAVLQLLREWDRPKQNKPAKQNKPVKQKASGKKRKSPGGPQARDSDIRWGSASSCDGSVGLASFGSTSTPPAEGDAGRQRSRLRKLGDAGLISPTNEPWGSPQITDIAEIVKSAAKNHFCPLSVPQACALLCEAAQRTELPALGAPLAPLPELESLPSGDFAEVLEQHPAVPCASAVERVRAALGDVSDKQVRLDVGMDCIAASLSSEELQDSGLRGLALVGAENKSLAALAWKLFEARLPAQASRRVANASVLEARDAHAAGCLVLALAHWLVETSGSPAVERLYVRVWKTWEPFMRAAFQVGPALCGAGSGAVSCVLQVNLALADLEQAARALTPTKAVISLRQTSFEGFVTAPSQSAAALVSRQEAGGHASAHTLDVLSVEAFRSPAPPSTGPLARNKLARLEAELGACARHNDAALASLVARISRKVPEEAALEARLAEIDAAFGARFAGKVVSSQVCVNAPDADAHCSVCRGGVSAFGNLIVFCDSCERGFHERCHVERIDVSATEWFCSACSESRGPRRRSGVTLAPPALTVQEA